MGVVSVPLLQAMLLVIIVVSHIMSVKNKDMLSVSKKVSVQDVATPHLHQAIFIVMPADNIR